MKAGEEVLVVTDPGQAAHDNVLPIECSNFESMCAEGDTLFVGRYLTNGADKSSVYLDVSFSWSCAMNTNCFCPVFLIPALLGINNSD